MPSGEQDVAGSGQVMNHDTTNQRDATATSNERMRSNAYISFVLLY